MQARAAHDGVVVRVVVVTAVAAAAAGVVVVVVGVPVEFAGPWQHCRHVTSGKNLLKAPSDDNSKSREL